MPNTCLGLVLVRLLSHRQRLTKIWRKSRPYLERSDLKFHRSSRTTPHTVIFGDILWTNSLDIAAIPGAKRLESHPISSNLIQSHPNSSHPNSSHPNSSHLIPPKITKPHSISQNNYKLLSNFFANFFFYSFQNILHFVAVITLCKIFVSTGENKFF